MSFLFNKKTTVDSLSKEELAAVIGTHFPARNKFLVSLKRYYKKVLKHKQSGALTSEQAKAKVNELCKKIGCDVKNVLAAQVPAYTHNGEVSFREGSLLRVVYDLAQKDADLMQVLKDMAVLKYDGNVTEASLGAAKTLLHSIAKELGVKYEEIEEKKPEELITALEKALKKNPSCKAKGDALVTFAKQALELQKEQKAAENRMYVCIARNILKLKLDSKMDEVQLEAAIQAHFQSMSHSPKDQERLRELIQTYVDVIDCINKKELIDEAIAKNALTVHALAVDVNGVIKKEQKEGPITKLVHDLAVAAGATQAAAAIQQNGLLAGFQNFQGLGQAGAVAAPAAAPAKSANPLAAFGLFSDAPKKAANPLAAFGITSDAPAAPAAAATEAKKPASAFAAFGL